MFRFFERLVNPFPEDLPRQPPKGIYQFCRYYTAGLEPWLLLMAVLTALVAIAEASLFGVLGKVVDWLVASDPQTFVEDSWVSIITMSILILVVIPILASLHSLVVHQTLMGNFPMSVRWMAHRYLSESELWVLSERI